MVEVAALGVKVTSDGVEKTTSDLNKLAVAADKADTAVSSVGKTGNTAATGARAFGSAATTAAGAAERAANSTNKMAGSADKAAKSADLVRQSITNASFQVQDFAVQVASGQSAMIAFAQQAPQFLGAFGFAGPLAIWGTAIGTIIAVGAAVLPVFMKMGGASKKLDETVKDLSSSFNAYSASVDRANQPMAALQDQFGANADKAGRLYDAMRKLAELDFASKMRASMETVSSTLEDMNSALARIDLTGPGGRFLSVSAIEREFASIKSELGLTEQQARSAKTAMDEVNSATTILGQAEGAQKLADVLMQARDETGKIPANVQQVATALYQSAAYGFQFAETMKSGTEAEKEAARAAQEKIAAYNHQTAMAQAIATYGRESAQVEALKRDEAMRTVDAYIEQNKLSDDAAKELRNAAARASDAEAATNSWANAMAGVKGQLDGIAGVLSSLGAGAIERVSIAAQNAALNAGKSIAEARKAGIRAQEDLRLEGKKGELIATFGPTIGGAMGNALSYELSDRRAQQDALEKRYAAIAEAERAAAKAASASARSGNAAAKAADQEIEKQAKAYDQLTTSANQYVEQQKLEAQTIGMTEIAAQRMRYEQDMLNQAANDNINLTPKQREEIKGLASDMAAAEAETKRLKDAFDFAKDATKGFITDLRTGLQNGEGFFQSFGNAALNVLNKILSKIEDELVNALFSLGGASGGSGSAGIFGTIISGIGKLFGFAKGGAFDGGAQRFAKGGAFTNQIVNRPTQFRFAKGIGLMGEAGPEAIMPLGRDSNGRLGVYARDGSSGSGVQYVQVPYIVSVEADDNGSIKAMMKQVSGETVAQAAPSIVQSANKSAPAAVAQYQQAKAGGDYRMA